MNSRQDLEIRFLDLSIKIYNEHNNQLKIRDLERYALDFAYGTQAEEIPKPYYKNMSYSGLTKAVKAMEDMQEGGLRLINLYRANSINLYERKLKNKKSKKQI